mmetsp:Transcript_21169/g.66985  ORF Transcript_21169/g.66985 Transcript_21169/m.66985 type:complete len:507 (-) Transcript_21169:67-1587(-)
MAAEAHRLVVGDAEEGGARPAGARLAPYLLGGLLGALAIGASGAWAAPRFLAAFSTTTTTVTTTTMTTTFTTTSYALTRKISFVTAETRGEPMLVKVGDFTERFKTEVVNLGEGEKWKGYKSKVRLLQKYLSKRMDEGADDELVAFVDGSDVIWGGCDPGYFQHAYEQIVEKSGATIVFSAELACGEQDCNKVPEVPQWAVELAGEGRALDGDFWKEYVDGCRATWTDECSAKRDCGGLAACADPPTVRFLNSGFVMGPVKDLAKLMDWSLENYDEMSVWGDQSVFASYWLENQEAVTLDYTGALAASISDLRWELLEAPLKCAFDQWVYLTSHRSVQLRDNNGKVEFSNKKTDAEKWVITDAGDGKVYVTSFEGRQLVDNRRFVQMSIFKTGAELWRLSVGGGGVVYLTSPLGEQLQDDNGHPVFSPNRQGWESWRIHTVKEVPACVETRPGEGIIRNWAFDRPQCLIHGNGRGFWFFKHIIMMLTNKTVEEVRNWGHHSSLHTR